MRTRTEIASRSLSLGSPKARPEGSQWQPLRPLRVRLGAQVEGAAAADVGEMRVEEALRGVPAALAQHLEEVVVGRELGLAGEVFAVAIEHDAVRVDAPVLPGAGAAREPALVD